MKKINIIFVLMFSVSIGCEKSKKIELETNTSSIESRSQERNDPQRPEYAIKAPDFTLMTVNGEKFRLKDMNGKVLLLNFWGTWCGPCRREIPDFVKLQSKYKKNGLEIVGITLTSGSPDNIKSFMDDWDINYTILTDIEENETQVVTYNFGKAIGQSITGIPTTLIIDRDGYIVKGYIGPRTEDIFYQDLKPYL